MDRAKRSFAVLRDWVEVYIPIASFAIMFLAFIMQVFFRYVVRSPLQWAYEVTVSCYLWLVMLGACLAQREHSHVVFTLITDKMPIKLRAISSFLGSGLIAVAFVWSFVPSVEFVNFMKMQETSVLKIGLNIVYAPYIPFLAIMILYMIKEMIADFRIFAGIADEAEIKRYVNEQMTEAEAAIESARKEEEASNA